MQLLQQRLRQLRNISAACLLCNALPTLILATALFSGVTEITGSHRLLRSLQTLATAVGINIQWRISARDCVGCLAARIATETHRVCCTQCATGNCCFANQPVFFFACSQLQRQKIYELPVVACVAMGKCIETCECAPHIHM